MAEIKARLRVRQGAAGTWASVNPVLLAGEPGYETDTKRLRIGDGVTSFTSLPSVEIGAIYQASSSKLDALVSLAWAANKLPYFTGAEAITAADLTAFARTLLDDADAPAMRTTLGLGAMATKPNVTYGDLGAALVVHSFEGIENNLVDNAIPTCLAVFDYVDGLAKPTPIVDFGTFNATAYAVATAVFDHTLVNLSINTRRAGSSGTISTTAQVRASNDGGSTWGSWVTVAFDSKATSGVSTIIGTATTGLLNPATGIYTRRSVSDDLWNLASTLDLGVTGINALELRDSAGASGTVVAFGVS